MALNDLARRRLCAQGIACSSTTPRETVARLTAVQAQDRPSALWAIGLRTAGATAGDVEKAVGSRSVVRTWLMRGTLHFAASEDVRWLLDLVAPRIIAGSRRRDEMLRLDESAYERSREVLSHRLESSSQLTRGEMMGALEEGRVSTSGQRGYHILWRLALEGMICFGPMMGKEPSFVLLDDWVPSAPRMTRERALARLVRRYFDGHGPASVQDLAWWSGITVTEAKAAIREAGEDLVESRHGGTAYWSSRRAPNEEEGARAYLLPGFDEYVIGYRDRTAVLDGAHTQKVLSTNGIFYPTAVIGGQVRGTWRAARKRDVRIEARMFSSLSGPERSALEEAASRYGRFLGLPTTLSTGDIA